MQADWITLGGSARMSLVRHPPESACAGNPGGWPLLCLTSGSDTGHRAAYEVSGILTSCSAWWMSQSMYLGFCGGCETRYPQNRNCLIPMLRSELMKQLLGSRTCCVLLGRDWSKTAKLHDLAGSLRLLTSRNEARRARTSAEGELRSARSLVAGVVAVYSGSAVYNPCLSSLAHTEVSQI